MRSCIALYFADFLFFHRFSSAAPTATVSVGPSAASTDTPVQSAVDIASHYVGYVGDPNGRGTASLVISCLLTLILCVWSALHLNVPYQGQSRFNSLLVNTRWIIAGVYAPELVVFTAWRQWSSAKLLGNIVKEMRENRLPPSAESQDSFSSASKVSDQANVPEWRLDDIDSQERDQPLLAKDNVNEAPTSIIPASVMIPSNEDSTTAQTSTTYSSPRNPPLLPGHQERKQQERPQLLEGRSPSISSVSAVRSVSHNFQKGKVYQNHHEWTMTHDFFASTGGFVFEIEPDGMCGTEKRNGTKFLPPECPRRLALTARGMALLARCGHLPSIARAEITDKSKANDLAKALVIIQACWMLVQVIGRLIAKLPVTLLEVNTIAHVMCAILMYAMWWHKPLAPKEPFVLSGEWVAPLCAYMYMSSEMSGAIDPKSIESQTSVKTLFAFLRLYSKVPELELMSYHPSNRNDDADIEVDSVPYQGLEPASVSCLSQLKSKKLEKAAGTAFFERRPRVKGLELSADTVSQLCINRWRLAAAAINAYPAIREHYVFHSHDQDECLHFKSEELLVPRVQNWPWDDLLRSVGGLVVGMVLWLACFLYGAVHMAAWNDHFPSVAEKWLWRSSSAYIGFCGGLWVVLNYGAQAYRPFNVFWEKWMDGGGNWWQNVLISVPVAVCGLSLILARAFILVEAFISIRELPAAAYDTPTWAQVFPHF